MVLKSFVKVVCQVAVLMSGLTLSQVAVWGQDYLIRPVPTAFVQDADTTFLVDLSTVKTNADYAVGNAQLTLDSNGFVLGGGYKGAIGFATAGNFPTNAWTLEMIVRVPYSARTNNSIYLADWRSDNQEFQFSLFLDIGFGVRQTLTCWSSGDYFRAAPYCGGNGRSIQASAPDKWVYIAFGSDFAGQHCMTAAREIAGDLLNHDINFAPTAQVVVGTNSPTEMTRRWLDTGSRFAASLPATLTLGNSVVEIKTIRLSNRYRSEVFEVSPILAAPATNTWTPQTLDASRTQTQSVSRTVGYPGYNNFQTLMVNEVYLPLAPGDQEISIQLANVPVGLYTYYVYGSIDPEGRSQLNRVWKPCPMEFTATDAGGKVLAHGTMLLKQSFRPRRMQGFSFHLDTQTTNVTLTFKIPANAMETARLQKIVSFDQLAGFPNVAVKVGQYLAPGPATQLSAISPARQQRDNLIWNALPPLNTPLQVHGQVAQFATQPAGVSLNTWVTKSLTNLLLYQEPNATFSPLDFLNTTTGTVFPQSNILSVAKWPSPYGEDPTGVFFDKSNFPSLTTDIYNTKRAELLGYRYALYLGAIVNSRGSLYGLQLPLNYFNAGDPEIGHDAAMALVRWAYDWPALEMSLHEVRLNTHSPDLEYNTDWSNPAVRNGKMQYEGWSGTHATWLFEAYDQLYPFIKDNQLFADEVHRFIPFVHTPQDVIKLLDNYLVFSSARDTQRGLISPSASIEDHAGQVLGPSLYTADFFDLTKQYGEIYPTGGGTYQEQYANALSRSGMYYCGSFQNYALGAAGELITKASRIKQAKALGVAVPMDISNMTNYPKVKGAVNFMLDMWVAGGFPFMVGDSSGGPHSSLEANNRLIAAASVINQAYGLYGDSRMAWVMKNLLGNTNAGVLSAANGVTNPILHSTSHVVPDWGAILELAPDATNITRKTAATLRLGIGQGHAHSDYLDLNLFGMGLPLAVDLACRNEGDFWSRPGANWSFLHNHALAHNSDDPNGAGSQNGEPFLRAFAPPVLRASYVNQANSRLDRDVIITEVGDNTGNFYAVDVQRIRGGTYHTWCFHGCESDDLQMNVAMQPGTTRWTDRCLEGTGKIATATTNRLQATWTMTRIGKSVPYTFNGGGNLTTVGCEPAALGANYNANLAPVHVRATLLNRNGDAVLQGNPYSAVYQYSFPFLWVQTTNEAESVYPAVYEWYRGETPTVANVVLDQANQPVKMTVTTSTGQVDSYEFATNYCRVVSRDSQGAVRWVKLSGYTTVNLPGLQITPQTDSDYLATIIAMDYATRTLTTSAPLPANPYIIAGNPQRTIYLQLTGPAGTSFTWSDDLLVQEGLIASLHITNANAISITANQPVLFDGYGNRNSGGMTVSTEDGVWNFRNNQVIKSPPGAVLTPDVFTDANGDGLVNMKTYEIGIGDRIALPVEITIQRRPPGWRVQSNVPLRAVVNGTTLELPASNGWQEVSAPPFRKILP